MTKIGIVLAALTVGLVGAVALAPKRREFVLDDGRVIVLEGWTELGSFANPDSDEAVGLLAEVRELFDAWDRKGIARTTFADLDYAFARNDEGRYFVFTSKPGSATYANAV